MDVTLLVATSAEIPFNLVVQRTSPKCNFPLQGWPEEVSLNIAWGDFYWK
jgi:hypothetical protein